MTSSMSGSWIDRAATSYAAATAATTGAALASAGLQSYDALLGAYSGDADAMRAFVGDGPLLTDDRPLLEYHKSLPARGGEVDLSSFTGQGRERLERP